MASPAAGVVATVIGVRLAQPRRGTAPSRPSWSPCRCPAGSRAGRAPTPAGRRCPTRSARLTPVMSATNDGPIGPRHRIARCSTGATLPADAEVEALERVDRTRAPATAARPIECRSNSHVVGVADQSVHADRQAVAVDLVAVLQPRLHDALAAGDLVDQPADVGPQLLVDARQIGGDDRAEQHAAEPGRRVGGQHQVAERHAPGGRDAGRVCQICSSASSMRWQM